MKRFTLVSSAVVIFFALAACNGNKKKPAAVNTLTKQEIRDGWQLLFDGNTLNGWKGYNQDSCGPRWVVKDSLLTCLGEGGGMGYDIVTTRKFADFELSLDWKISPKGNSGIFYHIIEDTLYHSPYETAPEYQLIDELGWPEKLEEWQKTGADYAMHNADTLLKKLNPVGEWNTSKIVFDKGHVEHWLNGSKIIEFIAWSDDWNKLRADGKWKDFPAYGQAKEGPIGLQNHGSMIWFRNIKVREL
jgi:hypothetical protein